MEKCFICCIENIYALSVFYDKQISGNKLLMTKISKYAVRNVMKLMIEEVSR